MAENTKIEWATHTFNPWIGCTKVSPACDHCYAEALMDHRHGRVEWGGDRSRTAPSTWAQPLKWNREAEASGKYTTVFCLSLGDIWDNGVDPMWRRDQFALIEKTPHLTWLLLSKRIGNAVKMCPDGLPSNAALGSTMINQEEWDRDYPKLKSAGETLRAKFTFASIEPMLGSIDAHGDLPDWVIVGGESGSGARPMHPDWARSMRDQCAATDTPFLFKQWGEFHPVPDNYSDSPTSYPLTVLGPNGWTDDGGTPGEWMARIGKKAAGRALDGVTHDGLPLFHAQRCAA